MKSALKYNASDFETVSLQSSDCKPHDMLSVESEKQHPHAHILECKPCHSERPASVLLAVTYCNMWLPRWRSGKESACQCRRCKRLRFSPWVGKIPWRKKWQPTPAFLPGKCHGQRSLVGYGPQDRRVGRDWAIEQSSREQCVLGTLNEVRLFSFYLYF